MTSIYSDSPNQQRDSNEKIKTKPVEKTSKFLAQSRQKKLSDNEAARKARIYLKS